MLKTPVDCLLAASAALLACGDAVLAQTPTPSADRAARAGLIFAAVDTDRNGLLTEAELAASEITIALGRQTQAAPPGTPSRNELAALSPAETFLRLFDANRDGRVSREEFQRAVAASPPR